MTTLATVAISVEWAALGFILAAAGMIGSILYNRWLSYHRIEQKQDTYNLELLNLKMMFSQYQIDMKHYLDLCELCRGDVRAHHEGRTAEHVTPALKDQISHLVNDVAAIKAFLMEHK